MIILAFVHDFCRCYKQIDKVRVPTLRSVVNLAIEYRTCLLHDKVYINMQPKVHRHATRLVVTFFLYCLIFSQVIKIHGWHLIIIT